MMLFLHSCIYTKQFKVSQYCNNSSKSTHIYEPFVKTGNVFMCKSAMKILDKEYMLYIQKSNNDVVVVQFLLIHFPASLKFSDIFETVLMLPSSGWHCEF